MESKPKVSVLLLVNQYADSKEGVNSLCRCIDSLVYQTLEEIEILVLLYKNMEDYRSVVSMYCDKFGEKIRICNRKEEDLLETIGEVLKTTNGDYIGIISEDIVLEYHAYATLYEESLKENTFDLIYGGYKYYENGLLLGCKDKRQSEDIPYKYLLKGELVLFNKLIHRNKIEELIHAEGGKNDRNFTRKHIWNDYGLSLRLIVSCNDAHSCNAVLFHQILDDSIISYRNSESYLEAAVEGIERTIRWSSGQEINTIQEQNYDNPFGDKREYLFARVGLELVRLMQFYWLYSNQVLPIIKKYKNSITKNIVFEAYSSSLAMFERVSELKVDAIPRILYVGAFGQSISQDHGRQEAKASFKEFGEIRLLNETTSNMHENPIIEKAYYDGKLQFVEEYFAVKYIVRNGGFYIGQHTQLLKTLDGLCCYDSVFGYEDRTTITAGFFAARKGQPILKAILTSYKEEYFEQMGYLPLGDRIRLFLIGKEEFKLDASGGLLKSGIYIVSPEQCIIPRYQNLKSQMQPSLCIINHEDKATDEEYIVVKKSTLEYLLSTSNDTRTMNKLKNNNAQLKKTLDQLLASRSIRLTKPLRSGYQKLKTLSHVFRG